jgi:hypothetical protein
MAVSITLTSCGRHDLLTETLRSLNNSWDGPDCELLIYEDADLTEKEEAKLLTLCEMAAPRFQITLLSGKVGQIAAIDALYSLVKTPLIFHCEDDWFFYGTGYYTASLSILQAVPNCSMVWLRAQNDRNGHPATGPIRMTLSRIRFQRMSDKHGGGAWCGFSFNPGLRRLADYQRIFPKGYAAVAPFNPAAAWTAESAVGKIYKKAGMSAFTLLNGYVRHTGHGRHI